MDSEQRNVITDSNKARQGEMSRGASLRQAVLAGLRSRNFYRLYILGLLLIYCTLFYYFGELVSLFGWETLRWEFFYGIHDIHRLFFMAPIIYAGYTAGRRGAIIITLVTLIIFLPRAFFISPFPDPILRTTLFTIIAGVIGALIGTVRSQSGRHSYLEALLRSERDKLSGILDRIEDGVLITCPDYKIRFVNPSMIRDFGEGIGFYCYKYLYTLDSPCESCKLPNIIDGKVERWEYNLPDGRTYEVLASPYADSDGVTCQLAIFRNITQRKKV